MKAINNEFICNFVLADTDTRIPCNKKTNVHNMQRVSKNIMGNFLRFFDYLPMR
jgi:hypothetical protein